MIAAAGDVVTRRAVQVEGQFRLVKASALGQHVTRERPEAPAHAVELGLGVGELEAQTLMHVLIEVLEERAARVIQARADLLVHLGLEGAERSVDLLRCAAFLIDG